MRITKMLIISLTILLMALNISSAQTNTPVNEFKKRLDTLNTLDPKSILIAKDDYRKIFKENSEDAEQGFRIFRKFYLDTIRECDHLFYDNKPLQETLEMARKVTGGNLQNPLPNFEKMDSAKAVALRIKYSQEIAELHNYVKCGIDFAGGEGDWYLKENNEFLLTEILTPFNFELKEYIAFLVSEYKKEPRIGSEGGLTISWDDLRKRIIRWEKFADKHPNLTETKEEISKSTEGMLSIYLVGGENTQIFDWDTQKLAPELKESYKNFIKKNPGSSYHSIIKELYEIYRKHDFVINKETMAFINAKGFPVPDLFDFLEIDDQLQKVSSLREKCGLLLNIIQTSGDGIYGRVALSHLDSLVKEYGIEKVEETIVELEGAWRSGRGPEEAIGWIYRNNPPIIKKFKKEHYILLPKKMVEALKSYSPTFVIWRENDFIPSVINQIPYPFSEKQAPFAVIGDFNGDKVSDVVLMGHDQTNDLLVCLLSDGNRFKVREIERSSSLTDPKKEWYGMGDSKEYGLWTYLSLVALGEIKLPYENRPLKLKNDGFELNYFGKASVLFYYLNEKFQRYILGD